MTELMVIEKNEIDRQGATALHYAAGIANCVAAATAFEDWKREQSENTIKNARAAINKFKEYLALAQDEAQAHLPDDVQAVDLSECDFFDNPDCWEFVTYGLLKGFKKWLLGSGFAVGTVNHRMATVRRFCALAHEAGVISADQWLKIRGIHGVSKPHNEDQRRRNEGTPTRIERPGAKKAQHVSIGVPQAKQLKEQPDTPQGRRDALLMCLLLDHGLRASEVAGLEVSGVDFENAQFHFYRRKVNKWQTLNMTNDSERALRAWFDSGDVPAVGPLLRGSKRGGALGKSGMSERAITARVKTLGAELGIEQLSAHDCRHYWATDAARNGTDPLRLQEAGGWSSLAMPRRYVEWARVANEGVRLSA